MDFTYYSIVGCLLAVAAGVWILVVVAGSLPILALDRAALEPLDTKQAEGLLAKVVSAGVVDTAWIATHNFEPTGTYRVTNMAGAPRVVAWTRSGERTYLCVYLVANLPPQIDFMTIFERGSLATGKSKDGQLLPNGPDRFLQTFTATTAVLWRRHEAGLKVLGAKRGLLPLATAGSLEQDFSDAMKMQASYIRSLPLWPLRIPYWYFVRRHLRHEKPVASRVHRS